MRKVAISLVLLCLSTAAVAQDECGSLRNSVGPWDYRTASPERRDMIERFHFHGEVERLAKHRSVTGLAGDISYTLRAFPNHPRALNAMAELARRQKRDRPQGSPFTVQCWFARAIEFQPDDGNVRLVYGITLLKAGERDRAIEQLTEAARLLPENGNVHYNLGLAYLSAKNYEKAREHAKTAYALGFNLPGLRDQLKRAGEWK